MPRRRHGPSQANQKPAKEKPFHNPFAEKAGELKSLAAPTPPPARPQPPAPRPKPENDVDFFRLAMSQVRPLDRGPGQARRAAAPRPAVPEAGDEDLEALAQLADLVAGALPLDVRDTDEYVEGLQPGLDPEILRRLAAGLFPVQDHLDLHGASVHQARERVAEFLRSCRQRRLRSVLIVHGRGQNSPEGEPVLKPHLVAWLSRSGLRKTVLAFASARPHDGGAGATYVLIRK